jgi:hypothetical protein
MKRSIGVNVEIYKNQWPRNMDFYKRRIMVRRALAAVFFKNKRFFLVIREQFCNRWKEKIQEAKAAGEDFNIKAINERRKSRDQRFIKRFYKKYGHYPFFVCTGEQ